MLTYRKNRVSVQGKFYFDRTLDALSSSGYLAEEALADLIDNSVDADATKVLVDVVALGSFPVIIIADNGNGMNDDDLIEAFSGGV